MATKKVKSDDTKIKLIFEHLDRLLICGAVMVGGGAVAKFNMLLTPTYPVVSIVAGLIIAFSGLGLTVWVVTLGMMKISEAFQSKIKGLVYGGLYIFLGASMTMALFFAGVNT